MAAQAIADKDDATVATSTSVSVKIGVSPVQEEGEESNFQIDVTLNLGVSEKGKDKKLIEAASLHSGDFKVIGHHGIDDLSNLPIAVVLPYVEMILRQATRDVEYNLRSLGFITELKIPREFSPQPEKKPAAKKVSGRQKKAVEK